jgi:hypothetical protein
MNCTHCQGTGFLNADQFPEGVLEQGYEEAYEWLVSMNAWLADNCCSCHQMPTCNWCISQHDIQVCNCCGDGDYWYGDPGKHYGSDDPMGQSGPYNYNGGLCECH